MAASEQKCELVLSAQNGRKGTLEEFA